MNTIQDITMATKKKTTTKNKTTTKRKRRTKAEIEADKLKALQEDQQEDQDPLAFLNDEISEDSTEEVTDDIPEEVPEVTPVEEEPKAEEPVEVSDSEDVTEEPYKDYTPVEADVEEVVPAEVVPAEVVPAEVVEDTPVEVAIEEAEEVTETPTVEKIKPRVRCATRYHAGRYLRSR